MTTHPALRELVRLIAERRGWKWSRCADWHKTGKSSERKAWLQVTAATLTDTEKEIVACGTRADAREVLERYGVHGQMLFEFVGKVLNGDFEKRGAQ